MHYRYCSILIFQRSYSLDVKSAFLYGKIEEDVYVCQPPVFEDPNFPDRVYRVEKALYGLHQAPRAWYETLSTYMLDNRFQRGKIDKTLFIKRHKDDILLVQVYMDDIIFSLTKKELCIAFEKLMHEKFQMSPMGELTFFLGLQVKQKKDIIFISQNKYVAKILKKFGFTEVKTTSTPMETQKPLLKDEDGEEVYVPDIKFLKVSHLHAMKRIFGYLKGQPKLGLWYPKDSPFDLVAYTNSDYAGASLDWKSTTGGCQFLGCRLISWQCKKQTVVANSTTEAEYVAASSCCGQVLWIQTQLLDYGVSTDRKAKKSVRLMMGKLFGMKLELMLFWSTVMAKTINREEQLHALVDGKKIIITESAVRRDLQLADEEDEAFHRVVGYESSDNEESLGEDASKQGRIDAIDADGEITLVSVHDVNVSAGEEVFTTTVDDITLAQVLEEMKSTKPKKKGIVIQELVESTTTIASQQSQDKGKGILIEPVKPMNKKNQIRLDEETALNLQAEFDEEERLARKNAEKEEEANIALIET
ncbi:putative ribonuclease H-like domain-containing protein [Tanacetum coccineum]|uniref:Ribonuclease H-like domain-containing protein n=1 Tax=Tanacetum coccineum TaxID=301880 RepID=A0ABQ5IY11_9ASTR